MRTRIQGLIVALTASTTACDRGSAAPAGPAAPLAVVSAHLAAENAHDVSRILSTLADTVEMRIMRPLEGRDTLLQLDRDGQRGAYAHAVTSAPESHFTVISQIVSGPLVISREEVSGLPGGSREIGLMLYRVRSGRIVALWILNSEGIFSKP